MTTANKEFSSLKYPSFIRSIFRFYFYLRTIKKRRQEVERLISIEETLEILKSSYEKAKENKEVDKIKIFNIAIFTLTIEYDVSVLLFMKILQLDDWNKQFLGRQLAVLLYESTDDFLELLGKDFRLLINILPEKQSLSLKLNQITKELNDFKKNNIILLKNIRNYCGAHRDKNAYKQLIAINNIDIHQLDKVTQEFMIPISKLTSYNTEVLKSMSKFYISK